MNIVVSSVYRKHNYIKKLIDSISIDIPIHIFVSQQSQDYIHGYQKNVTIETTNVTLDNMLPTQKALFNYKRCLEHSLINNSLICEDDVIFSDGWEGRFQQTVDYLKTIHSEFILSIFTNKNFSSGDRKFYNVYPPHDFCGTQGMYFTNGICEKLLIYLEKYTYTTQPYDMLLKNFFIENNTNVFVSNPSLIDHIGHVSTWNDNTSILKAHELL